MKRLLIAALFLLSAPTIAFADKCASGLKSLSFNTDTNLEPSFQELAMVMAKYQELDSSDPQFIELHRLIIQKSREMEEVLTASGYSEAQKKEVEEVLSSRIQSLNDQKSAEHQLKSHIEKNAREKEIGVIANFKEEQSPFVEAMNTSLKLKSSDQVNRILLSHDGRYYIAFHKYGAVIVDALTGARVREIKASLDCFPEGGWQFDLSQDRRFIVFLFGSGEWGYSEIYKISIDDAVNTIRKRNVNSPIIISNSPYKVGQIFEMARSDRHWTLLSHDRFLEWNHEQFPPMLTNIQESSGALDPIRYEHPSFKRDTSKNFYNMKAIDNEGKHLAIGHGKFIGIYNLETGDHQFDVKFDDPGVSSGLGKIVFSPDGKKVASYIEPGIAIWDLDRPDIQEKFIPLINGVRMPVGVLFDWSPDGLHLAVSYYGLNGGARVKIYSTDSGLLIGSKVFGEKIGILSAIKFSPSGDRVLSLDASGTVHIFKNEGAK